MATVRHLKAVLTAKDKASGVLSRFGGALARVGASATALVGAAAAVGAVLTVGAFAKGMSFAITQAGKFESQATRLRVSLANQGIVSRDVADGMLEFATALQKASNASESQIIDAQNMALNMGATAEQANQLAQAATDLSAALGIDVESATMRLSRTLGGLAGELGEIIPELKDLTSEQLRSGAGIDLVARKYKGFGDVLATTFEGSVNNVRTAFERMGRTIGGPFRDVLTQVNNAVLIPFAESLTLTGGRMDTFRQTVIQAAIGLVNWAIVVRGALAENETFGGIVGNLTNAFAEQMGVLMSLGEEGRRMIELANQFGVSFENMNDPLLRLMQSLVNLKDQSAEVADQLAEIAGKDGGAGLGEVAEKVEGIAGHAKTWAEAQLRIRQDVEMLLEPLATVFDTLDEFLEATTRGTRTLGQQLSAVEDQMWQTFGVIGMRAVGEFSAGLVDAATGGDFAFGKFFKRLLKDLATAIVKALFLKAILTAFGGGGLLGIPVGYRNGGIVGGAKVFGANAGMMVPGLDRGRDSVPALLRPGEMVIPREITQRLMNAAGGGGGSGETHIHLHGSLPSLVDEINTGVQAGRFPLRSSETVTTRTVR